MKKHVVFVLGLSALLALAACAPKRHAVPPDTVQVWPKAPKPPRIAYVKTHRGESDYYKPTFLDVIFGGPTPPPLAGPYGIVSANDKIYTALVKLGVVAVMDPKEKKVAYIGQKGRLKLQNPLGVAVSSSGIVYVSDPPNRLVLGFDQEGTVKHVFGQDNLFERPTSIAVNDELQRLYVVDNRAHKVKVLSLTGEQLFEFGQRGNGDGELNFPLGIAMDSRTGNIVLADAENFRIQIFDRDGKFLKKFGQAGDGFGSFGMPKSTAVDREGNIYVTDGFMQNVQIFDQDGNFLLYIMGAEKGQTGGQFQHPGGIFVDDKDRIFLTDVTHGIIQEYQYLSERWIKEHPDEYKRYIELQPKEAPAPAAPAEGARAQ